MIDPHTLPALWRRVVKTTRTWTEPPLDDDTQICVLWSDGEVSVDDGNRCQKPWQGTGGRESEIGWTTPSEFAAFLTRPAACAEPQVPEVVRSVLESAAATRENFARVKPTHEMAGMNADTARAIRAWLAALPITPEVVRNAVRSVALMHEEHGRGEREKSESTQLRAWLAALPPIPPEVL